MSLLKNKICQSALNRELTAFRKEVSIGLGGGYGHGLSGEYYCNNVRHYSKEGVVPCDLLREEAEQKMRDIVANGP